MTDSLLEAILDGTPSDIIERYRSLTKLAETLDFGEYDENTVVLDTETTGVSFKKDELTQIAAARLVHGEITEWFVTFVNPGMPIPEEITVLTNISDEDVAEAPTPEEALLQLVEFVGDAKIVAHNAYFDHNFVTRHPQGYPLLENQWIDSLELSRIALPRMRSHRLLDLACAFGGPQSTHRADDDVVATCAIYRILLAAVACIPHDLLFEIGSYADPKSWPFGEIFRYFATSGATSGASNRGRGCFGGLEKEKVPSSCDTSETTPSLIGRDTSETTPSPVGGYSLLAMRRERIADLWKSKQQTPVKLAPAEELDREDEDAPELTAHSSLSHPLDSELEDAFSPQGLLGAIYDDFEPRSAQLKMALAVNDAYKNGENLVVEAGTGTGKSMAYLVPSVLLATRNNIRTAVATKTNALLDQLVYKELPALSLAMQETGQLDRPIEAVPLKGFTHYPCLFRIQRIQKEGPRVRNIVNEEKSQAPALAALLSYIEQTAYDDMDNLKIDYRVLPKGSITTNSSECLRRRCPFFGKECFVFGNRQLAEQADVVVTNHSLLFYDAVMDNALLPPIKYWVVDEAHSAEEDARKALSLKLSLEELSWLCTRVTSEDGRTNIFKQATRAFEDGAKLLETLIKKGQSTANEYESTLTQFISAAKELHYYDPQPKSSYDTFDLWINEEIRYSSRFALVKEVAQMLIGRMEKLTGILQEMVVLLDDEPNARYLQRTLASAALEFKENVIAANEIFNTDSDKYVYSVTLNRHENKGKNRSGGNAFHVELYNVGAALDETLYAHTRSVVYTSATLTVGGSFETFEQAVGLNCSESSKAETLKLESCFDFDNNMQIVVVSDIPDPNSPAYIKQLQEFLTQFHEAQGGSVLTLFTNKRDLDACFEVVGEALKKSDLRIVSQRRGVSVKGMRDEFIKNDKLSMFALKSFWEGFDAPGDTLRSVVVPRLPFGNPNDPLSRERANRDDRAWAHFDLPKAVIELRQAAGRLIRKADDRGIFVLCDTRLLTKSYGKVFISSLPSSNVKVLSASEVYSVENQ